MEVARLQRTVELKTKEMNRVKKLAKNILEQVANFLMKFHFLNNFVPELPCPPSMPPNAKSLIMLNSTLYPIQY